MDRALRLWFLALYAFGILGFLGNVFRIRRDRPAFERQIGPLPEVGALIAWFIPPLILLSGIGTMAIEQPILRVLGVGLSLLFANHGAVDRTNPRPPTHSWARGVPRPCLGHLRSVSMGPPPALLRCVGPLARGGAGYAELAPAGTLALVRGCNHQRVADRRKDAAGQVRCTIRGLCSADRSAPSETVGTAIVSENLMNRLPATCYHLREFVSPAGYLRVQSVA